MLVCCAMPVEASDFHLEEYEALRKEIEWLLKTTVRSNGISQ